MAKEEKKSTTYRPRSLLPKESPTVAYATCYGECGKSKKLTEFYKAHTENNGVGAIPFCKQCVKKMVIKPDGDYDLDKLAEILKHPSVDKPFLHHLWQSALNSKGKDCIGRYFSLVGSTTAQGLRWRDSDGIYAVSDKQLSRKAETTMATINRSSAKKDFIIEDWMIDLFGDDYLDDEYYQMVKKYNTLKENYTESTSMHTEALVTYIRYKVKEEMAVAQNQTGEAKTWSELANKAATNAKINPSQLSKADLMGGISTISEISQAVEQAVDIIPILPQFKYRPNDAIDFTIWCYVNYCRDLEGKPLVEYEDVYKFYDERVNSYIKQYGDPYGIFENDTTKTNRESVKNFIQLPKDEDDSEGEDNG